MSQNWLGMANNSRGDTTNIHVLSDALSSCKPHDYLSISNKSSSSPVTTGILRGLNGVPQLFPLVFRLAVTLPAPTGGRVAAMFVYCARDASDSKLVTPRGLEAGCVPGDMPIHSENCARSLALAWKLVLGANVFEEAGEGTPGGGGNAWMRE